MQLLETLFNEIIGFLGVKSFFSILNTQDYSQFLTYKGVVAIISPIMPLLLLLEFGVGLFYKKAQTKVYQVIFIIYVFNRFIGRFISIAMVTICIGLFQKYAPFQTQMTWYWFIYGYVVWEFGHFIYHFLAHKVRLFWCLHSTHHTPEDMNLSVSHAHFFLEAPYADLIRTTVCILLGVHPAMLFVIMFVDGTYGTFIHAGENLIKNGRLGFLNKIILTPSHHRVHHARNPLYIDTNYCNLLNIWDRVFRTYQEEDHHIDIDYGVTREINSGSFIDVYFGEFITLFKDVKNAPGIKNKLRYIFNPPGWDHNGDHKTASKIRIQFLEENSPIKT
jgi:sterol desaturase/sphingolipid hydroxylase (fatty acid hydroxylase superfamily)|tara:strand:- start:1517 stop:2515 length:999 start_codon:yes stop_codon:yes gene_type:complete